MGKPAIVVENMSMMFNLNKEKVDNLKEYFIKLVTRKLHFTEFWALRDISFTVEEENLEKAVKLLEEAYPENHISTNSEVSKVSVVGGGMQSHAGVAAKMFEALYKAGINIHMISTSEIKISVLIDRKDADKAVEFIHDEFIK